MTRALLITNPAAARTDARAVRGILDALRSGGWTCDVQATTAPGDARRIARLARDEGVDVLVSYGGDGTAMQVAAGIVGTEIPLGIVPGGTGNLLAGNLRLPRDPIAAARLLLRGRPMPIDLGAVERDGLLQYFAVCSGTGFDALLMAATPGVAKRRWKMGAYISRALLALPAVESAVHRVTVDGTVHERPAAMVLIVNCGELLPPFLRLHHAIAPNDGWLDVMTLDAQGTVQSVLAFLELLRSSSRAGRRLWFARGRHVHVETVDGKGRPVQLDGDVSGVTPFEARLVPGALSVLVDPTRVTLASPVRA
ncbi:MAG TPA: diacylglycerol kinase family protein [Gemmatimonadales bacterium]|nr:diacylglycerol kinase family protein [Gemmatimonadales bacterium]